MSVGIVILGGNLLAYPSISHITKLGFKTIVVDKSINSDLKKICSETIELDFSDSGKLISTLMNKSFKAIIPINDFGVLSAALASKYFNLIGYSIDSALNVTQKHRLKRIWLEKGIKTPHSITLENKIFQIQIDSWNFFPCIIKPSFVGGGSRGVKFCKNREELYLSYNHLKFKYQNKRLILEEFIFGSEHSSEVLIQNGKINIISISDKINYSNSKTVVQNLYFPGFSGNKYREELNFIFQKACSSLGIINGAAHFEFIVDKKRMIYLLEVGGRPGGGLNFFPISLISTGYDYPKLLLNIYLNRINKFNNRCMKENLCWHFFNNFRGLLKSYSGFEKISTNSDVVDTKLFVKKGDYRSGEFSSDLDRPGYVLFKFSSLSDAHEKITYFDKTLKFNV